MSDHPKAELPPPHAALSLVKMMFLIWFLFLSAADRQRVLKIMVWVSELHVGPVNAWLLDIGRPLSEAEEVITAHRQAAAILGRYAVLLESLSARLPEAGRAVD
jgi:hypothetical protein